MTRIDPPTVGGARVEDLAERLGVDRELDELMRRVEGWISEADSEFTPMLRWQLLGASKRFRPMTIFTSHRARHGGPPAEPVMRAAVVLELWHNVALVIDDILDRSRYRRGKLTLHCRFGSLPALMTTGYMVASGFDTLRDDPYSVRLLAGLLQRLGAAECRQWRLRRRPLGVEDWRSIAGQDTGVMFEVCARLGTRDDRLGRFGHLLGVLYHGCDDVADIRGLSALGGGGEEDLRDGILTLPMAFAIRDPRVAVLFGDSAQHRETLMARARDALPAAEDYLDQLAGEARRAARAAVSRPAALVELVDHTRELSRS